MHSSTYEKNFLDSVVFRLDFDVIEINEEQLAPLRLRADFPNFSKRTINEVMQEPDDGGINIVGDSYIEFQFKNPELGKEIVFSKKYVRVKYNKGYYKNKSGLLEDIKSVKLFIEQFGISRANRIGLRYINIINNPISSVTTNHYIHQGLLGGIEFCSSNGFLFTRLMTSQIIDFDDDSPNSMSISFQYGYYNRDYPNKLINPEFVLDYDGISKYAVDLSSVELSSLVSFYNEKIEDVFEKSITDNLRNVMRTQ